MNNGEGRPLLRRGKAEPLVRESRRHTSLVEASTSSVAYDVSTRHSMTSRRSRQSMELWDLEEARRIRDLARRSIEKYKSVAPDNPGNAGVPKNTDLGCYPDNPRASAIPSVLENPAVLRDPETINDETYTSLDPTSKDMTSHEHVYTTIGSEAGMACSSDPNSCFRRRHTTDDGCQLPP
ncbi:hypothetical protein LSH36_156g05030 [Paralvinella palmiformis]|uniref:Uncharacterized protein n=1 Tax=Paralvinella palmiformis TaxID=53620 RepID=A0AAD9N726_9ANNE|nr:hypothetical protein LSH36_156g05030 [Paralvinella palmiformis]